jgi:hypothetical protein
MTDCVHLVVEAAHAFLFLCDAAREILDPLRPKSHSGFRVTIVRENGIRELSLRPTSVRLLEIPSQTMEDRFWPTARLGPSHFPYALRSFGRDLGSLLLEMRIIYTMRTL